MYMYLCVVLCVGCVQVVIGGRNKYLINGSNATPSRVQDLFRSVQLNVNNPHFLIMQVHTCTSHTFLYIYQYVLLL